MQSDPQLKLRKCGSSPFEVFDLPPVLNQVRESKINEVPANLTVPFTITNADQAVRFSIPVKILVLLNYWI